MGMALHLLTDLNVRNAKPKAKAYRKRDGGGLFLYVPPTGVKAWQFRYKLNGLGQTATLGKADRMTLSEARERAADARVQVSQGFHLTAEKRLSRARNIADTAATFGAFAEVWLQTENRRARWTPDYCDEVAASIKNHLGELNQLPIADITAAIAAPVLRRCERHSPDMAKKVRQRLRAILDQAVEDGLMLSNPLPPPRRRRTAIARRHMPALVERHEVGAVLRAADAAEVSRGVRRAHLLAAFTAQRIGEIVPAQWSEINFQAGTWSIPRSRMKRKDEERGDHEIPLPPILLTLMREWRRADGSDSVYVCPAPKGDESITREAVEKFYRRGLNLTGRHSPHSWRSVFSTWCREAGKDGDLVEAQLDHVIGNRVQGAYDRAKRLALRCELVEWYVTQLLAARDGADIIPLHRDVA
jgi:integrase